MLRYRSTQIRCDTQFHRLLRTSHHYSCVFHTFRFRAGLSNPRQMLVEQTLRQVPQKSRTSDP